MSSNIDITKPVNLNPSLKSIRDNFATTKTEIEILQNKKLEYTPNQVPSTDPQNQFDLLGVIAKTSNGGIMTPEGIVGKFVKHNFFDARVIYDNMLATGIFPQGNKTSDIIAAYQYAVQFGIPCVQLAQSGDYIYDVPITDWNLAKVALIGSKAKIWVDDPPQNTTIWTWNYDPDTSGGYRNQFSYLNSVSGLAIINRGTKQYLTSGSTLPVGSVAMKFNSTDNASIPAGVKLSLSNILLSGFEKLVVGMDRWYLTHFDNTIFHNFNIAYHQAQGNDSGELNTISKSLFTQGNLCCLLEDDSSELMVFGTSFDYCNQLLVGSGPIRFQLDKCHVECRGKAITNVPSSTSIMLATGSDPRAAVAGRDAFIDLNGDGANFVMSGGLLDINNGGGDGPYDWIDLIKVRSKSSYAKLDTVTMNNIANTNNSIWSGPGWVDILSPIIKITPSGGGMPTRISSEPRTNLLLDSSIEDSNIIDNWFIYRDTATITNRLVGTNIKIARSTLQKSIGNSSLEITKLGTGTGRIGCVVPLSKVGSLISKIGKYFRPVGSTGSVFCELRYCQYQGRDTNGVPIVRERADIPYRSSCTIDANGLGTWRTFSIAVTESTTVINSLTATDRRPTGCNSALLVINCDAMTANQLLYVDDLWLSEW